MSDEITRADLPGLLKAYSALKEFGNEVSLSFNGNKVMQELIEQAKASQPHPIAAQSAPDEREAVGSFGIGYQARPAWQRAQSAPVVPGLRHTDKWESARVADYNAGWNDRHTADFSRLSDEQIFDIAEPFGEFRYGDAQGDKRLAFARAIIAAIAAAPQPARKPLELSITPEWVRKAAEAEQGHVIAAGVPDPAARQEQGDEVRRLREALTPFAAIEIDCATEIVPNGYADPQEWRSHVRDARAALSASAEGKA